MRRTSMRYVFVESTPPELEEGVLYVSIPYATAVHTCACGCGNKVVTPLSPADWQLLFDGETVSLMPSIGNWEFPCRSHYWIRSDVVHWAEPWTDKQIAAGRRRDGRDYERYMASRRAAGDSVEQPDAAAPTRRRPLGRLLARIARWLGR